MPHLDRRHLLLALGAALVGGAAQAQTAPRRSVRDPAAEAFVAVQAQKVLSVLADRGLSLAQKEAAFRFAERTMDGTDAVYTFVNPEHDFPQRIVYRRGSEGWLYVHVEGKLKGEERQIIYPLRRVDCESGEFITK